MMCRLATILCAALAVAPTLGAAPSEVELPRYRLEVGQELVYSAESRSHMGEGGRGAESTWTLWVTGGSEEEGWRILACQEIRQWDEFNGRRHHRPEAVRLGWVDLQPDGAMAIDPHWPMGFDPVGILPPLPPNPEALEAGWESEGTEDEVHRCTLNELTTPPLGLWVIDVETVGPMSAIYELTEEHEVFFNAIDGRLEHIESRSSQGWGMNSSGTGSVNLSATRHCEPERLRQLEREAGITLDALAACDRAVQSARRASAEEIMAEGEQLLLAARDEVTDERLLTVLQARLDQHARDTPYLAELAVERVQLVGDPSPAWEAEDLEGSPRRLEDFRGQVLVLDFWYRGCGWCIRAMPQIKEIAAHFEGRPVAVLGMNNGDRIEDAQFVIDAMELNYEILIAPDVADRYEIRGFPTLLILDQEGVVRDVHVGWSPTLAEDVIAGVEGLL
jgi:thiol-disulfide isomerase/thioredoxin